MTTRPIAPATLLALWALAGAILLAGIGGPSVTRTQEARVFETARQMRCGGARAVLLPTLNGEPRLKKPPLAYWMSFVAYRIAGVSESAGRVPTALMGWFTIALTFALARRMFDQRTALVSAAALLGSFYFFRFNRFAETDAPAATFLTFGVYAICRAASGRSSLWMHTLACAAAGVILVKGGPALLLLTFFIALCAIEKRWDLAIRFFTSGAILTLAMLAAPWFVYIQFQQGIGSFTHELSNTMRGGDHFGWPWVYVPVMFIAVAPWSGILPIALWDAIASWRSAPGLRVILTWFGTSALLLMINSNKQNHYLTMLLPPMMILIGHLLATWPSRREKWLDGITWSTLSVLALLPAVVLFAAWRTHRSLAPLDILTSGAALIAVVIVFAVAWRKGARGGALALLGAVPPLLPLLLGLWIPSLAKNDVRAVAAAIHERFGEGPFVYVGDSISLPLCFQLRTAIPLVRDGTELAGAAAGAVVIVPTKNDAALPTLPAGYVHETTMDYGKDHLAFFRFAPESR